MSLLARVKSVQKASMDAQGFSAQALAARDFSDQGSSGDAAVFEPLNHEVQSLHDQHASRLKHDLVKELGLDTIARIAHSATLHNAYDELSVSCQTILNTSHYEGLSEANHPELIKEVLDEYWVLDLCNLCLMMQVLPKSWSTGHRHSFLSVLERCVRAAVFLSQKSRFLWWWIAS